MSDDPHTAPETGGAPVESGVAGSDPMAMERAIQARMTAMDREIRRLRGVTRWLGIGLVVATGVAVLLPTLRSVDLGGPEVVEARSLVLVGPDGTRRGEWSVDEDGASSLTMLDPQARPRLSLTVRGQGHPGLSLTNAAGERRVALGLLPDETTSLVFADGAGVPRTVLGLVRGDAASLVFADAEGVSRIGFGLDGRGTGSVILPETDEGEPES